MAISFSAIFIRLVQDEAVPSLVITAWRTSLAAVLLLPPAVARRRKELMEMKRTDWALAFLSGMMLGIHFASWISSLAYTSVASSTVLATTSPLWVGLVSPFFLGESLSRSLKVGIALALVGSVVIAANDVVQWTGGRPDLELEQFGGSKVLLGNGLALLAAFTAAVYLMIGRRLRSGLSLLSYTTVVYSAAALFLLFIVGLTQNRMSGYSPRVYLLCLLMAIFPQLIGHTSFNWALGFLPAAYVSVAVISEPIGATLLALFIFGEVPGLLIVVGSCFIFAGIWLASRRQIR